MFRRGTALVVSSAILATALFSDPLSKTYPLTVWLPVAALYAVTAAGLLVSVEGMTKFETWFWRILGFVGFLSAALMLAFGLAAALVGTLAALTSEGRTPSTSWIVASVGPGVVVTGSILCAVFLRGRSFYPEPHHPRLAALDSVSLGAAILAIQAILVIPESGRVGWAGTLMLIQVGAWSVALSGAFVNVLQRHPRFDTSSRWILLGCAAISVGSSLLFAQIMYAREGRPTGGSAIAALILAAGAWTFGEAFDADRRAAAIGRPSRGFRGDLYPSLEHDSFRLAALADGGPGLLRSAAGPLISVAGPLALAITLAVILSGGLHATASHRAIVYTAFAVSLTASVAKLAFGRLSETQAQVALSAMLMGEKALVDEILVAVDKDRSTVAERIHDALVQPLTAAYLKLSHAQVMLERGEREEGIRILKEGSATLSEQIAEARSLVTTVYPPSLDHLGITAALKELVAAYRRRGLAVEAHWDWAGNVDRQVAVAIYRIANEALENALLHADPKRARLHLCAVEGGLELEVADEGPGFEQRPELDYIKVGKLGMATMRRVADIVGATLEISSSGRTIVRMTNPRGGRLQV